MQDFCLFIFDIDLERLDYGLELFCGNFSAELELHPLSECNPLSKEIVGSVADPDPVDPLLSNPLHANT
jgi:hypothetical protein